MFCSKCGNILPDNANFCTSCGAPQDNATRINTDCDHEHRGASSEQVGFMEASALFFVRAFNFTGRSSRGEYWWAFLFCVIAEAVIGAVSSRAVNVWNFIVFLPRLSLTIRRLHDVGKSWKYYLWNLLPVVGQIMVLIQMFQPSDGTNEWGRPMEY